MWQPQPRDGRLALPATPRPGPLSPQALDTPRLTQKRGSHRLTRTVQQPGSGHLGAGGGNRQSGGRDTEWPGEEARAGGGAAQAPLQGPGVP